MGIRLFRQNLVNEEKQRKTTVAIITVDSVMTPDAPNNKYYGQLLCRIAETLAGFIK